MMRIIAEKHINKEDEKIAQKLGVFCNNTDKCKDLLIDTLNKIEVLDSDVQMRNMLNSTKSEYDASSTQPAFVSRFSRIKVYMPIAAVALILAGGIFIGNRGFENSSTLDIINNSSNKPDGTVSTTTSAITTETNNELDIENQLQAETQASVDEIYNTAKSIGDTSNELSL